jgi:uncharacterized protein (TIGR03437 family)
LAVAAFAVPVLAGPTLEWSKTIANVAAVAIDFDGNTYVASDVPQLGYCATNTLQTPDVCPDVLITKLNPKANVVYSTTLGGSLHDLPFAIAVDAAGNAYIAGSTDSSDFPVINPAVPRPPVVTPAVLRPPGTPTSYIQRAFSTNFPVANPAIPLPPPILPFHHAFVVKLSADGKTILYSTVYGGTGEDIATSLAVDWTGSAYVAGSTTSLDLPAVSAFQPLTAASALAKSTDGGSTFNPVRSTAGAGRITVIALDPNSPTTIFVAGDHGFLRSADGGSNWNRIPGDWTTSIGSIAVAPGNSSLVLAATVSNLYQAAMGLYRSTDGGITWERSNITADPTTAEISSIAFGAPGTVYASPSGCGTVIIGNCAGGVYRSADSGLTWQPTGLIATPSSQGPPTWVITDLVVDPTNASVIYAATEGGVMKSFDAGGTWVEMNTGINVYPPPYQHWIKTLTIDPNHPSILYAGSESLYKSTDGGFAWQLLPNTPWPGTADLLFRLSLVLDPQHPGTLYVARYADPTYPGDLSGIPSSQGLWKVENDGATWTKLSAVPVADSAVLTPAGDLYVGTAPSNAMPDGFVFKLDATGSKLAYSTYFGGTLEDYIAGIAVDYAGQAYITGQTESPDLPLAHPLQSALAGGSDTFVAEISADGTLLYSTYLGGQGDDSASGIAIDLKGSIVIAGTTNSPDFPTANPAFTYHEPHTDAFVTRIAPDGASLVYSTYFGGSGDDSAVGVALDVGGNTYVAGTTNSPDLPVVDPIQASLSADYGSFAAALDPAGSLLWSTYLGTTEGVATSIAAAPSGSVVIGGSSYVTKLDVASSVLPPPTLPANAVVNGASFRAATDSGGGIAPGSIVSIFGSDFASSVSVAASQPLLSVLGETSVTFNGALAPLFFVSPRQINALVPPSAVPGVAVVQVRRGNALSVKQNVTVVQAAPGLFIANGCVAALHAGTTRLVSPADPANVGEYVEVYGTGLGTNPSVRATLDGHSTEVSWAGLAPGFAGLNQINIKIPIGFSPGAHRLVVSAGGVSSNAGLLWTK